MVQPTFFEYTCPTCNISWMNATKEELETSAMFHSLVCDGNPARFWGLTGELGSSRWEK